MEELQGDLFISKQFHLCLPQFLSCNFVSLQYDGFKSFLEPNGNRSLMFYYQEAPTVCYYFI